VAESQRLSTKLGPDGDAHPIDAMYKKLGAELAPAAPEEVRAIRRDADYG